MRSNDLLSTLKRTDVDLEEGGRILTYSRSAKSADEVEVFVLLLLKEPERRRELWEPDRDRRLVCSVAFVLGHCGHSLLACGWRSGQPHNGAGCCRQASAAWALTGRFPPVTTVAGSSSSKRPARCFT